MIRDAVWLVLSKGFGSLAMFAEMRLVLSRTSRYCRRTAAGLDLKIDIGERLGAGVIAAAMSAVALHLKTGTWPYAALSVAKGQKATSRRSSDHCVGKQVCAVRTFQELPPDLFGFNRSIDLGSHSYRSITALLRLMFRRSMRIDRSLIIAAALLASASAHAQNPDDDLRVYAVGVVRTGPIIWPFSGYGVYLGESTIITAAHVVGRWPLFTNPTIIIGGQEIQAKVIKKGAVPPLDLAQLSVEQASLPISLRLRRNHLCKEQPDIGTNVVVVYPEQTVRSRIISPQAIAPQYRSHFGTLISEPRVSGSGLFDANKKCLLGIMSAAITRNSFMGVAVTPYSFQTTRDDRAGYFVPASTIADFLPVLRSVR
jgi:hypothetical protein